MKKRIVIIFFISFFLSIFLKSSFAQQAEKVAGQVALLINDKNIFFQGDLPVISYYAILLDAGGQAIVHKKNETSWMITPFIMAKDVYRSFISINVGFQGILGTLYTESNGSINSTLIEENTLGLGFIGNIKMKWAPYLNDFPLVTVLWGYYIPEILSMNDLERELGGDLDIEIYLNEVAALVLKGRLLKLNFKDGTDWEHKTILGGIKILF